MDKLFENAKKELEQIGKNGLSTNNLETAYKLSCIGANVKIMEEKEEEEKMKERYIDDYGARGSYREHDGRTPRGGNYTAYVEGEYGRRYMPNRYRGSDGERFERHLDLIEDGIDMYMYGRERYFDSGDKHRMQEGLEKFMYGICMFIETAMDFAETPEEKEVIRKHIQKIKSM